MSENSKPYGYRIIIGGDSFEIGYQVPTWKKKLFEEQRKKELASLKAIQPNGTKKGTKPHPSKEKGIQLKDVSTVDVLKFLRTLEKSATWYWSEDYKPDNSVGNVMPMASGKVLRLKMRKLISKGLVTGCSCGCRGDFEITAAGTERSEISPGA